MSAELIIEVEVEKSLQIYYTGAIQKRRNKSGFVFLRQSLVIERKTLVFFLKTRVCPGLCWDRIGDITP